MARYGSLKDCWWRFNVRRDIALQRLYRGYRSRKLSYLNHIELWRAP